MGRDFHHTCKGHMWNASLSRFLYLHSFKTNQIQRLTKKIIYMYFNHKDTWEGGGIRLVIIGLLERHKFKASQGPYWSPKQDTSPLLLNTLGFRFWRYLMRELIWHLSQSSIRPSIYFSLIVKSHCLRAIKVCRIITEQIFLMNDFFYS